MVPGKQAHVVLREVILPTGGVSGEEEFPIFEHKTEFMQFSSHVGNRKPPTRRQRV